MSNVIPPLLSSSPPPIGNVEDDDDEFGDFSTSRNAYGCYDATLSMPSTPTKIPLEDPLYRSAPKVDDGGGEGELPNPVPMCAESIPDAETEVPEVSKTVEPVPSSPPAIVAPSMYSEEPPELPGDIETPDFGDFECNTIPVLEHESDDEDEDIDVVEAEDSIPNFAQFDNGVIHEPCDISKSDSIEGEVPDLQFGTFSSFDQFETEVKGADSIRDEEDFGAFESKVVANNHDFADFECQVAGVAESNEDDFGDFASNDLDDDFGDFDDFTTAATAPVTLLDPKDVYTKSKSILEVMFTPLADDKEAFASPNFVEQSAIFNEVKNVTETNALTYQWGKSSTQKGLLKALKIDTRNILYGHCRNSSMPKFAANLGPAPLEPIKSETPSTPPVADGSIPTAQFDWTESGLANPLDSSATMLLDLEQLVASLDSVPAQPNDPNASDLALDDWNLWLESVKEIEDVKSAPAKDTESVNSLQLSEVAEDFEAFASFQSGAKEAVAAPKAEAEDYQSSWGGNMVPLRETYITNTEVKKPEPEEPGWLKPTILTPVLPRKEEDCPKAEAEDFDDFASFQVGSVDVVEVEAKAEEDFSGFQNFETPAILQPVPTYKAQSSTEINWPDPGVTDEEMARFELYSKSARSEPETVKRQDPVRKLSGTTGTMLVEKTVVVPANKVVLPSREVLLPPNDKVVISKDLVLPILESSPRKYTPHKKAEDDDWSDFVSGQATERTATPELSLCIPQLSNIQPPKLPIPVITPQGLMQTKIPSQSITQKHAPLISNLPYNGYQPSIISNQFALQLNQNPLTTPYQTTSIPANAHNGFKDDSDEWSDFVSAPNNNNAFGWPRQATPNIITNPVHHQNGSGGGGGTAMQLKKNNIPSISALPDLDFATPKARNFKSKK